MDAVLTIVLAVLVAGTSAHVRNALLRHVTPKQAHGAAV